LRQSGTGSPADAWRIGKGSKRWLTIAEKLLSCPTAAGFEDVPAAFIREFVRQRQDLSLSEDRAGNLLVRYPARKRTQFPPLAFVAHLDHPSFVVEGFEPGGRVRLAFRGGVQRRHVKRGALVEFFRRGSPKPIGRGELTRVTSEGARDATRLGNCWAAVTSGSAAPEGFAMWALPGFALKNGKIASRALDDLLGASAALATLDEMQRRRPKRANVWALFTRAEEIGLFGAFAAIAEGTVPKSARVLSLEASRALPHAPQGGGVIVRVGDAISSFEPRLTGFLHRLARQLAQSDPEFRFQRRLMDGGSCEATAFCAAGYRSSGLTLPMENYHNMRGLDGSSPGLGPEQVDVRDFLSELKLLVHLAERSGELDRLEEEEDAWMAQARERALAFLAGSSLDREARSPAGGNARARARIRRA
jgi:endoglucanase